VFWCNGGRAASPKCCHSCIVAPNRRVGSHTSLGVRKSQDAEKEVQTEDKEDAEPQRIDYLTPYLTHVKDVKAISKEESQKARVSVPVLERCAGADEKPAVSTCVSL